MILTDVPDTPEKAIVDDFGCELSQLIKDDDGDGVRNELDLCPGTPPGAAVDKDGVHLKHQKYSHTPSINLKIKGMMMSQMLKLNLEKSWSKILIKMPILWTTMFN